MSFDQFSIDPRCLKLLKNQGISEPTPVQAQAIPVVLEGADLTAIAQTGTGKTLAFGLPSLSLLAQNPPVRNSQRSLKRRKPKRPQQRLPQTWRPNPASQRRRSSSRFSN